VNGRIGCIGWDYYLHKYWSNWDFIGEQIIILLLISKNGYIFGYNFDDNKIFSNY